MNPFNLRFTLRGKAHSRALLMSLLLAWALLQTLGLMHRAQHALPQPSLPEATLSESTLPQPSLSQSTQAQVSTLMPDHAAGSPDCLLLDALCAADTQSGAHMTELAAAQPPAFFSTPPLLSATLTRYWHAPARAPPVLS
jgi:hypothetical protein